MKTASPKANVEKTSFNEKEISVEEVWKSGYDVVDVNDEDDAEEWKHGYLTCDTCLRGCTEMIISCPINRYLKQYRETTVWFDHGFIIGLGALLVHQFHRVDIEVVNVLYSKSKVTSREMIPLRTTVTKVFSVLHSTDVLHYVVAEVRPTTQEVFIFDGFGCALRHWLQGVTKVLLNATYCQEKRMLK